MELRWLSSVGISHRVVIKFFDVLEERAASILRVAEFVQVDAEDLIST
jgi:hypothetical protein